MAQSASPVLTSRSLLDLYRLLWAQLCADAAAGADNVVDTGSPFVAVPHQGGTAKRANTEAPAAAIVPDAEGLVHPDPRTHAFHQGTLPSKDDGLGTLALQQVIERFVLRSLRRTGRISPSALPCHR